MYVCVLTSNTSTNAAKHAMQFEQQYNCTVSDLSGTAQYLSAVPYP